MNNSFAGKCPYGYSNFYVDITKYLNYNEPNALKVVVKNGVPSGRWYTGGGIYRDVNLMIAGRLHLVPDSVQLAAIEVEDDQAIIRAKSTIAYTAVSYTHLDVYKRQNTIRLAHYQHAQEFYDLCDEYGMVVWAEIPYITMHMPNGRANTLSQMEELVVQNYNQDVYKRQSIC